MSRAPVPRRLLLVSYYYPPVPANSARPLTMAKYLRRRGHEVHVLTTSGYGALPTDAADRVHRAGDLFANPTLRRLTRRPPATAQGAPPPTGTPPPGLLTKVVVPELTLLSWTPAAVRATRRLVAAHGIECVITSSPTESSNLAGLAAARGAAWVVEFRDPWRFKPEFPTAPQRALDRRLERLVTARADGVVALQDAAAEELETRFGRSVRSIPNGWDPDLGAGEPPAPPAPGAPVTLVHTGHLSGEWGRSPDTLFAALRRLREREPEVGSRLRLVLAGPTTAVEEELLAGLGMGDAVRHLGHLSREESLALQRSADALLLMTSDRAVESPGKLVEYIAAGRPVVALGDRSEAARIVRETGVGVCVPGGDAQAAAGALRRVVTGELSAAYAPHGLDRFTYPAPALAMEEEIEAAITRAGAQRRGAGRPGRRGGRRPGPAGR